MVQLTWQMYDDTCGVMYEPRQLTSVCVHLTAHCVDYVQGLPQAEC